MNLMRKNTGRDQACNKPDLTSVKAHLSQLRIARAGMSKCPHFQVTCLRSGPLPPRLIFEFCRTSGMEYVSGGALAQHGEFAFFRGAILGCDRYARRPALQ